MALPLKDLDDRRFDQLVLEARERLSTHLPELTQIAPGDPINGFVDLFAWLTESIIYRMNLLPERQRRLFLNLLQIPLRPAVPSRGVICLDASEAEPRLVPEGTGLKAGDAGFTTVGEVLATPLSMSVVIKQEVSPGELAALGFSKDDLRELYGSDILDPRAFQPRLYQPGLEKMSLADSIDKAYYLALLPSRQVASLAALREQLAGKIMNIAIVPNDERELEQVSDMRDGKLSWELLSWDGRETDGEPGVQRLPLDVISDSSRGGKTAGVVRLRMPYNPENNPRLFHPLRPEDPMLRGLRQLPPDVEAPDGIACWLRLSSADEPDLPLTYLGVNGIDLIGQAQVIERVVAVANGEPDQVVALGDTDIDPDEKTLRLEVQEDGGFQPWELVSLLGEHDADAAVFQLDPAPGLVRFGDGQRGGRRPPRGARIRATYLHGGGSVTNVAAGKIRQFVGSVPGVKPRQDLAMRGGIDAETVDEAERRIPAFLNHRNRAITPSDFRELAVHNPVNPVARADVVAGLLPGSSIRALREDVPGVVSVFVMPPSTPVLGRLNKPTERLLEDVFEYLLDRVTIGTELYVLSPEFVPIAVSVAVEVDDPRNEQQIVRAVREAVVEFCWAVAPGGAKESGWPLGGAVDAREVYTRVARVEGVKVVLDLKLFRKVAGAWSETDKVVLSSYQLPELQAVAAVAAGEAPVPGDEPPPSDSPPVPTPVIPELC